MSHIKIVKRPQGMVFLFIAILLACSLQSAAQTSHHPDLNAYVDFLGHQPISAKDYILNLFESHDIVIVCERAHPEITQYDLFLSVVSDPRFIKSAGNVFTEIGISTQGEEVNKLLHSENLPADVVDQSIMRFQRNCSFYPIWENYNYTYFLRRLYSLNQKLSADKKVNLFNSDVPFDWNSVNETSLKEFWSHIALSRDSIIASQVIQQFDRIVSAPDARHKALVIMNYRHAFGNRFEFAPGVKPRNVGRYLFDKYGDRVANVYLNFVGLRNVRSDNDMAFAPIQAGKWDAAFKILNIENAGFDFKNSPFGKDTFDIWPMKVNFTYADVFDGFVFYLPLGEQKNVTGIPGFIDSTYAPELKRRYDLFSRLPGGRFKPLTDIEGVKNDFSVKRERPTYMLDSLNAQINRWIIK